LLQYAETPVQEIHHSILDEVGVRLLVKREDLNHPLISGNKWWKLKYNLEEAANQKKKTLLTFGGAYSNHIYATAAAAREAGFESIGIIRGEETQPLNNTLNFAQSCGMKISYATREAYRNKTDKDFVDELHNQFGEFYIIPEGGTNALAVKGCSDFATEYLKHIEADYVCLPVGTGGTMAGIIDGLHNEKEIIGFPVLKAGEFLYDEIKNLLHDLRSSAYTNWTLETNYHFGGYAKFTDKLLDFIREINVSNNLPLDHVYTAKLFLAVLDCAKKERFKRNTTVLTVHTGGLQGTLPTF
jgi:1-aminocyclopropane-1-carboxylate deaminase